MKLLKKFNEYNINENVSNLASDIFKKITDIYNSVGAKNYENIEDYFNVENYYHIFKNYSIKELSDFKNSLMELSSDYYVEYFLNYLIENLMENDIISEDDAEFLSEN